MKMKTCNFRVMTDCSFIEVTDFSKFQIHTHIRALDKRECLVIIIDNFC